MFALNQPRIMIRFSSFTFFFLTLLVALGWGNSVHALSPTDELTFDVAAALGATMADSTGTLELGLRGTAGDDPFRLRLIGQFTPDADDDGFSVKGTCTIIIPDLVQYEVPVEGQLQLQEVSDGTYRAQLSFEDSNAEENVTLNLTFQGTGTSAEDGKISGHGEAQGRFLAPDLTNEFIELNAPAGLSIIIDEF